LKNRIYLDYIQDIIDSIVFWDRPGDPLEGGERRYQEHSAGHSEDFKGTEEMSQLGTRIIFILKY